jgi:hypothetical protein
MLKWMLNLIKILNVELSISECGKRNSKCWAKLAILIELDGI